MSQTWVWVLGILLFVLAAIIRCAIYRAGDGSDQVGYLAQTLIISRL